MKNGKKINPGIIALIACTLILVLIAAINYFSSSEQVEEEYERKKEEYYSNAQSNLQSALESMDDTTDEPATTTSSGPVTTPEPIQPAHNEGEWIIDIEDGLRIAKEKQERGYVYRPRAKKPPSPEELANDAARIEQARRFL